MEIATSSDAPKRGYGLEKLLNELFTLFDLDPKASFKITGEQIDGAFTFKDDDYLLEAKWQKELVNAGDLYKFAGVINGKRKKHARIVRVDGWLLNRVSPDHQFGSPLSDLNGWNGLERHSH